jgi:hypothetical protein
MGSVVRLLAVVASSTSAAYLWHTASTGRSAREVFAGSGAAASTMPALVLPRPASRVVLVAPAARPHVAPAATALGDAVAADLVASVRLSALGDALLAPSLDPVGHLVVDLTPIERRPQPVTPVITPSQTQPVPTTPALDLPSLVGGHAVVAVAVPARGTPRTGATQPAARVRPATRTPAPPGRRAPTTPSPATPSQPATPATPAPSTPPAETTPAAPSTPPSTPGPAAAPAATVPSSPLTPPATPLASPVPASVVVSTPAAPAEQDDRPGWGKGDKSHDHSGPPGLQKKADHGGGPPGAGKR